MPAASPKTTGSFQIAPFQVDVTPPIGHPLAYGVNRQVDAPLYVRGLVIDDGASRAVVASADFLGIAGQAYRDWKGRIARAAGTSADRVFLHTVHQHDSLFVKFEADELLKRFGFEPKVSVDYWADITTKLEAAVRKAVQPGRWQKVKHLATAERRLEGLAANRRLLGADSKVRAMRFSMCNDEKLKKEPVGKIDPILRTIGFLGARDQVLATIHFYATHPQVAYNRNMAGSDLPGVALGCLEKATAGHGMHLYLTGCGADITYGKYTFVEKEKSLRVLGQRLGAGLVANVANLEAKPTGPISIAQARFEVPLARQFTPTHMLKLIKQATDPADAFWKASLLTLLENWKTCSHPPITRLSLGPDVHMLSMPSEVVVEYQLYAQSLAPDRFVACAAYGDYSYAYFPTAAMYAEGGYEPKSGMWTPAIEASLKAAIDKTMTSLRT